MEPVPFPPPIFAATEQWILDAYEGFVPPAQPARKLEALHSTDGHLTRHLSEARLAGTGSNAQAS